MSQIHDQLRQRRKALGLRQQDMEMRLGMPRQQYQRLEAGGNPRLDTLELVAKGLNLKVMLVPEDKLLDIHNYLDGKAQLHHQKAADLKEDNPLTENPWQGLLGEEDE
ncbi:helix-turn-helix transcriptional regulator [Marinospirillum sp.]|uniref:helix-turn-helix domain-containing protein n=1 Tax=Marinospirillum sp. TaxID=2183934 RepID=UPI00286FD454|nr:helix-turn-helix transcriptional regulator [Marinospirillum sp.]MDR9467736.1 helix-turn-helix transcriptional regulator [Marinospirillum sp.]